MFKRLSGSEGEIDVPAIGLKVGTMESWTLSRHEETPPELGVWDLRADFSYIHQNAFSSDDLKKRITVVLGNPKKGGSRFLIKQIESPTYRTQLEGKRLMMEGVQMWPAD